MHRIIVSLALVAASNSLQVAHAAQGPLTGEPAAITFRGEGDEATLANPASLRHGIVFQEEGKFGGWPANGGMWQWGDEILVCFTKADHKEQAGHTFDKSTARNTFGRSLDGGLTWTLEDARHWKNQQIKQTEFTKGAK